MAGESKSSHEDNTGKGKLTGNAIALYIAQAAIYGFPLVVVPYLARVLGNSWGEYSIAFAFSAQSTLIVEYGFGVTGNRSVAANRHSPDSVGRTLGAIMGAKAALAILALTLAAVQYMRFQLLHQHAWLFWLSLLAGITQGCSFVWFLQGMEMMWTALWIDLGARTAATALTIVLVRNPRDTWIFFALQASFSSVVAAIQCALICRRHSIIWPNANTIIQTLRQGFAGMLNRPGLGLFAGFNTYVLGFYSGSSLAGLYAGAERITRAMTTLPSPICQAVFPRISWLVAQKEGNTRHLQRISSLVTISIGALASVASYFAAPQLVHTLLGPNFESSIGFLRTLSPIPFLAALNQVFLYQYLLPRGIFAFGAIVLFAAPVLGLVAWATVWRGNAFALAASAVIAESAAALLLGIRAIPERV